MKDFSSTSTSTSTITNPVDNEGRVGYSKIRYVMDASSLRKGL